MAKKSTATAKTASSPKKPRKTARTGDLISRTAQEKFGFETLRPGQREAIEALLAGRDTLAVMPTGSDKSAIYQIAGSLLEGATLVISPLIALFYHGGLKAAERHQIQERFMADEADVIVATNAFGMGIDKADVRFVYHFDVSDSLDSYYQEIGRAGRDGEKAEAVLFFRQEDMGVQKFHTGEGKLEPKVIEKVANVIAGQEEPVDIEEVSESVDLSERKLTSVIHRLEDVGALETLPSGEIKIAGDVSLAEAAQAAADEQERRKEMKQERLRQMQEYADISSCRREHLLRYFGDSFEGPCCNCDNCEAQSPGVQLDPSVGTRREVA